MGLFVESEQGDAVVARPMVAALLDAQRAFQGAAVEAGLEDEDDVQALIDAVRYDRPTKQTASAVGS